jgi:hypothetical protein
MSKIEEIYDLPRVCHVDQSGDYKCQFLTRDMLNRLHKWYEPISVQHDQNPISPRGCHVSNGSLQKHHRPIRACHVAYSDVDVSRRIRRQMKIDDDDDDLRVKQNCRTGSGLPRKQTSVTTPPSRVILYYVLVLHEAVAIQFVMSFANHHSYPERIWSVS